MNRKNIYYWLLLPVLALMMGACSKTDEESDGGKTPEIPNVNVVLTEEESINYFSEFVARSVMHGIAPDAPCNDVTRYWQLAELLANQPTTASTRGAWSGLLASYNFKKAVDGARATHRATLIGAMVQCGKMDKKSREQIWHQIMDAKQNNNKPVLEEKYRVGCDEFWEKFSKGEMDDAAIPIYHAVFAENVESKQTAAQQVAEFLLNNNLREIDMTLKCAGPIISAGADVVFAYGDDLIQYGKLAYDFVETNSGFVLQAVDGNLTSEKCIDTMNFNLKLLTQKLKEIVPTTQDLKDVLFDLTAEQLKALQKEIQKALDDSSGMQLTKTDLEWFTQRAKNILHIDWKPGFLDKEYVGDTYGLTISIESPSGKGCYTFYCTNENENVLLQGRCALSPTTITLYVTDIEKGCERILPRNTKVTVGDIFFIPYKAIGYSTQDEIDLMWLWYNSSEQSDAYFNLKKDTEAEVSPAELTFEAEGGTQESTITAPGFSHFGVSVDNAYSSWLSATPAKGGKVMVTAMVNTTSEKRTGYVKCYVAKSADAPESEWVWLTPIKVTQKARTVGEECWVLVNTEVIKHENTTGDRGQYMNYSASETELRKEGKVIGRVGPYKDVDKLFDLGFVTTIQAPPTTLNAGDTLRIHITAKRTTDATIDKSYNNQVACYDYIAVEMWWNIYNSSGYFGVENLDGPKGGPSSYSTATTSSWDYVYRVPSGRKDKEESVYLTACGSKVIWTYRWGGTSD